MTIQELEEKHFVTWEYSDGIRESKCTEHTKLSIQFAIKVLEKIDQDYMCMVGNTIEYYTFYTNIIEPKIQELKQYLNE